jgi:hypothetical protein
MPAIFDLLYRLYCRARLTEMRKRLFLTRAPEVREASCGSEPRGDAAVDQSDVRVEAGIP